MQGDQSNDGPEYRDDTGILSTILVATEVLHSQLRRVSVRPTRDTTVQLQGAVIDVLHAASQLQSPGSHTHDLQTIPALETLREFNLSASLKEILALKPTDRGFVWSTARAAWVLRKDLYKQIHGTPLADMAFWHFPPS